MKVLILGDSSSAGIGPGLDVYPYRLFQRLSGCGAVELQNHSSPGITSADAACYFERRLAGERWDAVVVYLGNNEGSNTGRKGRYLPDHGRRVPSEPRSRRDVPSLPPTVRGFPLSPETSPTQGPATTPWELRDNLSRIAVLAGARGARVILVNPIANRAYPAGAGPWLSPFLKIVDAPWRIGHLVSPVGNTALRIRAAICAQERGWRTRAVKEYEALLWDGCESASLALIASNNLAVLLHEVGRCGEAAHRLMSAAHAGHACSAVAAYNLARMLASQGRQAEADSWFDSALEQDASLYRVKTPYRDAIASLASPDIQILDLATVLPPNAFVDYCHPTPTGHAALADALQRMLKMPHAPASDSDGRISRYESHFPSPNAFHYSDDTLLDYYDIAPPFSTRDLADDMLQVTQILKGAQTDGVVDALSLIEPRSVVQYAITRALAQVADHPLITSVEDICRWPLRYTCEVGRLPEHFVYRVLTAYLAWAHTHGISAALGMDDVESDPIRLRASYRALMVGQAADDFTPVNISDDYRRRLRRRVLAACHDERLFEDIRPERTVTVLRWYTREAFRYGTPSRVSMLYPRPSFDAIIEGLRVWMLLARFLGNRDDEQLIEAVYAWLRHLERLHISHARRFVRAGYSTSLFKSHDFRRTLLRWRARLPLAPASGAT